MFIIKRFDSKIMLPTDAMDETPLQSTMLTGFEHVLGSQLCF